MSSSLQKLFKLPRSFGESKVLRSWIGGKFVNSTNSETKGLYYPATNGKYAEVQDATVGDVNDAIAKAVEAQKEWASWSPTERGRVLRRAADLLTARNDELAVLETIDTGRPIQETDCVDIVSARDAFEYYSGVALVPDQYIPQPNGSFAHVIREPLGVGSCIGAFNYPIQSAGWKAGPALATGNAVVFKPSEDTPMTALALGPILQEAGLPDGLYNVVLGGREVGECMTTHPDVAKISFTGGVETGRAIYKNAAAGLKKVQMELGGKSPLIIFEDADLDQAVSAAMLANWYSAGEVCSNGTRIFVHESIKSAFIEQFVERTKKLIAKAGDPLNPETQLGPLINKNHMEKVLGYIDIAKNVDQARLLCGGGRITDLDDDMSNGFYVAPTIFDGCTDDMRIVKEEVFGPVASVLTFQTEEEVIKRANATEYGLSAGVFSENIKRCHRVIRQIQAGTTWINNYNLAPAELAWTGHKNSGIGCSNGTQGIDEWTQIKTIYCEMGKVECPYE